MSQQQQQQDAQEQHVLVVVLRRGNRERVIRSIASLGSSSLTITRCDDDDGDEGIEDGERRAIVIPYKECEVEVSIALRGRLRTVDLKWPSEKGDTPNSCSVAVRDAGEFETFTQKLASVLDASHAAQCDDNGCLLASAAKNRPTGSISASEQPWRQALRSATLAIRIPLSAAKVKLRTSEGKFKRPTWNLAFETAVTALRSAAKNAPRNVWAMRLFADRGVPDFILPPGLLWAQEDAFRSDGTSLALSWVWSESLTPQLKQRFRNLSKPKATKLGKVALDRDFQRLAASTPVILYLHGGAYCLCSTGTHREFICKLALASNAIVVVPAYRRPPDFSMPAPLTDALLAYKSIWMRLTRARRSISLDGNVSSKPGVVICGDSAGGALAVSTLAVLCHGENDLRRQRSSTEGAAQRLAISQVALGNDSILLSDCPKPIAGALISPWVDLTDSRRSTRINAKYDYLPRDLIELFADLVSRDNRSDPLFSPIHGELDCLPPLLVQAGQCEVLRDQIEEFAARCNAAGGKAQCTIYRDMVHVFPAVGSMFHSAAAAATREIGAFVNRAANQDPGTDDGIAIEVHSATALCSKADKFDWNVFATKGVFIEAQVVGKHGKAFAGRTAAAPSDGSVWHWDAQGIDGCISFHCAADALVLNVVRGHTEIMSTHAKSTSASSPSCVVATAKLALGDKDAILWGKAMPVPLDTGGSLLMTLFKIKGRKECVIPRGVTVTPVAPAAKVYAINDSAVANFDALFS